MKRIALFIVMAVAVVACLSSCQQKEKYDTFVEWGFAKDANSEIFNGYESWGAAAQVIYMGNSATLIVKARNDGGAAAGSVTFGRAFLGVDVASAEAPADITKPLEIHIDSNVPYYFTQTGLDFAELELTDNTLTVNLTRNTSLQPRGGEIVIADVNDVLVKTIPVTQKAAVANNDTDRAALMAIYDALNMKEWTEYGAFGSYYANWGTDAPMDK